MRSRDLLLLLVGAVAGFALAQFSGGTTNQVVTQARSYVATHTIEVFVGVILVGIILTLMGKGSGGGRR